MPARRNPVVPRLQWVAKNYDLFLTDAVAQAWAEATGSHALRTELEEAYTTHAVPTPQDVVNLVSMWVEGEPTVPSTTRFDRHLPWLAKALNTDAKDLRRMAKKFHGRPMTLAEIQDAPQAGGRTGGDRVPEKTPKWPGDLDIEHRHILGLREALIQRFRSIVDWAEATGTDLGQLGGEEAMAEAEQWGLEERPAGKVAQGQVIYTFPDGWTVQDLRTAKELEDEGRVMQHCVDEYDPDQIGEAYYIYSLRDPNGNPHATVEWEPDGAYAVQVKGKQNVAPKPEYLRRLAEWRCTLDRLPTGWGVWEQPYYNVPDHADGLGGERFIGLYTILTGKQEGYSVLLYEGGIALHPDALKHLVSELNTDVDRYLRDAGYSETDEAARSEALIQELDRTTPRHVATFASHGPDGGYVDVEVPGWAEFLLWMEGATFHAEDEMVEQLVDAGVRRPKDCAPARAASNPRLRRTRNRGSRHEALKRKLMR